MVSNQGETYHMSRNKSTSSLKVWEKLVCVLRAYVKDPKVQILSRKFCQFILLEIEINVL